MEKCFIGEVRGFQGEYRWLSNFFPCKVIFNEKEFPSAEHAFQYAKVESDPGLKLYFENIKLSAARAKKWGRQVPLRSDWPLIKREVMKTILRSEFENEELREKLKRLKGYYIEETNGWGDTYWGVCRNKGHNWLGKYLMSECQWIHSKGTVA